MSNQQVRDPVEDLDNFYRDVVRKSLRGVNDPELRLLISSLLSRLIIIIRFGNQDLRNSILSLIFDNIPSDVALSFIEAYLGRLFDRYKRIESVLSRYAPRQSGGNDFLAILSALGIDFRDVFYRYVEQKYGVKQPQPSSEANQQVSQPSINEEELKKLIFGGGGGDGTK